MDGVEAADLLAELTPHVAGALIALDFDGTLAPIVADPEQARPVPGTVDALTALARLGARVAVITGRDAQTVVRLGGLDAVPDLTVAGLYGAEWWQHGELRSPPTPDVITQLRQRLPALVAARTPDRAVWIEDKRLSLVVHARRAADPAAAIAAVRPAIAGLAGELGLELHDGREVLELRLSGFDKGAALRRLAAGNGDAAVLFAGDDLGDLPAFAVVRELRAGGRRAWGVAVHSSEAPQAADAADLVVAAPADVVGVLSALAG